MAEYQADRVPVSAVRVATTTADETVAFINEKFVGARIRLGGRGDDFRHELTGFATPSLQVASYRYTRGLSLDIDPFGYLMAVAVTGGNAEVRAKREQAAGGGGAVFLLYPPVSPLRVGWGDAFAARLFAMPLEQVERVAAEQAGVARAGATVAGIARTWGWASPSRFAAAYRRRFGVLPGQTLGD